MRSNVSLPVLPQSSQFRLTASQYVQPAAQQILLMFFHSSVMPCSMIFGLCPWASRGRAHFHRLNSFISDGNRRAFVITLAPVPSSLCILWSAVVVFEMFVKTQAQESLEFGLKIHSFADVHVIGFWRRVAKAVKRQEEHSIFRDDLRTQSVCCLLYLLQYLPHLGELKVCLKILVR